MSAGSEICGESLGGAFRIVREQVTDALLLVLLANQPEDGRRSAPELRNHAHGVILGLQQILAEEHLFVGFAEELGSVLCGLTNGSENALIDIAAFLDTNLRAQVPSRLRDVLRLPITRLVARVMAGWIARSQQTPERRDEMVRMARNMAPQCRGDDLFRKVIDQSPIGLQVTHLGSGAPVVHNPALERLFGYTLEEEMLIPPELMKNEDSADDDFDLLSDMLAGRIPCVERISARPHKDGHSVSFHMLGWPIRDAEGTITHIANAITPVERHLPETEGGRLSATRARYLLQLSPDPVLIATADGIIRYASPSVESTFGLQRDDLIGKHLGVIVVPSSWEAGARLLEACLAVPRGRVLVELEAQLADGSTRWHEIVATNLLDIEEVQGIVLQGRDITDRRALQHELERAAHTDSLTGLRNRRGFVEYLRSMLAHAEDRFAPESRFLLVCYADLDLFKQINDRFGHAAGDAVLAEVGAALGGLVEGCALAGRMGGDEFVIHAQFDTRDAAERFLVRLSEALHGTIVWDGLEIAYAGTYGAVAEVWRPGLDAERLLGAADQQLGRAKASGIRGLLAPEYHQGNYMMRA